MKRKTLLLVLSIACLSIFILFVACSSNNDSQSESNTINGVVPDNSSTTSNSENRLPDDFEEKHNHSFNEGKLIKSATCYEKGSKQQECECGFRKISIVKKSDHTYIDGFCSVCGAREPSKGLEYSINSDGTEYTVVGIGSCQDTHLIIPRTYNGLPVTAIGPKAFLNSDNIERVILSDNITRLSSESFLCDNLMSIIIPDSVDTIPENAFHSQGTVVIYLEAERYEEHTLAWSPDWPQYTDLLFVDGVENYSEFGGDYDWVSVNSGFAIIVGYNSIETNIQIPTKLSGLTVNEIGCYAFYGNDTITNVEIPEGIEKINFAAFENCEKLKALVMSDSVEKIGRQSFAGCDSLSEIVFSKSSNLTSIENGAFLNCRKLESFTIFDKVTDLNATAFENCTSLKEFKVSDENQSYSTIDGNLYSKDCATIVKYADGKLSTEFKIPENVKYIGTYAFSSNVVLERIVIPNGALDIEQGAFAKCENLKEINIPNSISRIRTYAFDGCTNLTKIAIPIGVFNLDHAVFIGCDKLTIYCESPKKMSTWDSNWDCMNYSEHMADFSGKVAVVYGVDNVTSNSNYDYILHNNEAYLMRYKGTENSIQIPSVVDGYNVVYIGNIFENNSEVYSIEISSGIKEIGVDAFSNCTALKNISIPDSVTTIGAYAFSNCESIVEIVIPSSIVSIGKCAFLECKNLNKVYITDLEKWCCIKFEDSSANPSWCADNLYLNGELVIDLKIPNGVRSISSFAFYSFSCIRSVELPSSITYVGANAFLSARSNNIEHINFIGTVSEWCKIKFDSSIIGLNGDLYFNGQLATEIVIPDDITSIGNFTFSEFGCIEKVVLSNNINNIGLSAFSNCSNLTSITISNGVTSIGDYAFFGCKSLSDIVIPNSVTSIGMEAFRSCERLNRVIIPNSVTEMGYSVFSDCDKLTIYCESEKLASGWNYFWNSEVDLWNPSNRDECPVIWGYISEE